MRHVCEQTHGQVTTQPNVITPCTLSDLSLSSARTGIVFPAPPPFGHHAYARSGSTELLNRLFM